MSNHPQMPLLLSDLDETILARRDALRRWAVGFVSSRGLPATAVDAILDEDRHGARTRPEFVEAVNGRIASDPPLTLDYLRDYVGCFELSDDTADALVRARGAGWRIAVVSNGEQPQVDKIDHVGLRRYVDAVAVSAIDGSRKPDPGLFRIAAERAGADLTGAALASTWMIGDDAVNDIGGAHAVGVRSVWLRHGRDWPVGLEPPTAQAESFPAAVDLVLSTTS